MINGKLYCVLTNDDMSPVLSVYQDDAEAICAFRNLILTIRKDIQTGVLNPGTDSSLSLECFGFLRDGVIYGIKEPVHLLCGDDVSYEVSEDNTEIVPPCEHCEVFE